MPRIKTELGVIYIDWQYAVFDSNNDYLGCCYNRENAEEFEKEISKVTTMSEFANVCVKHCVFSGCYYANSKEELLKIINDDIKEHDIRYKEVGEEALENMGLFEDTDWLNQVGNNFIWEYESGIGKVWC